MAPVPGTCTNSIIHRSTVGVWARLETFLGCKAFAIAIAAAIDEALARARARVEIVAYKKSFAWPACNFKCSNIDQGTIDMNNALVVDEEKQSQEDGDTMNNRERKSSVTRKNKERLH
jgi:hypothetical protein